MDKGWFNCELIGLTSDCRTVRACIRHNGDAGNRETTKFVCESALALCGRQDALPGGTERGGVLTPATGLGVALAERLRRAHVAIEISESECLLRAA